jgi:mono/diheme cytochrome c family protein
MALVPVSAVEAWRHQRRWRLNIALIALVLLLAIGVVAVGVGASILWRMSVDETPAFASTEEHFKYGSIGSEPTSGMPYWVWKLLPKLYPDEFGGRDDFAAFGFLYETDAGGKQRDLPIGVSRRNLAGVDLVWLNCAVCHTGTWRAGEGEPPTIIAGMPSNHLDFEHFIDVVLRLAVDDRIAPDQLFPALEKEGAELGPVDRLVWRVAVLPRFREGLLRARARMGPLLALQPDWGVGRVDTFNPYKVLQFNIPADSLTPAERVGVADLPAIFDQHPREGMNLHWDGNNASLQERNLSAAIGAGVTPETVDHDAISRTARWLGDLRPLPSPHRPDPAAVERGLVVYRSACADCHGWNGPDGYVFSGLAIGKIDPIAALGTDRARLDSYTDALRDRQLGEMFAGTHYAFRQFRKTDGYANLPLDGLWLRGPYLHNGAVPTLADLLKPPAERPRAYLRGSDVVDGTKGGFQSPPCNPAQPSAEGFCFDTTEAGNGNGGHLYGTDLGSADKADLIAYLLTF